MQKKEPTRIVKLNFQISILYTVNCTISFFKYASKIALIVLLLHEEF